jgi:HPt (histidine-containing phosphotransfer) domain-containing protein/CheY-like chemotaxis protein
MNSLRVLFVDRDSPESEQICSVLAGASHLVLPAASLDEACEALFVQKFDAVLLGSSLPQKGLPEFGAKLRQFEDNLRASEHIPILSLSPRRQGSAPRDSVVNGYLPEPFEPAAFAEAVESLAKAINSAGAIGGDRGANLAIFEPQAFREQVGQDPDLLAEIIDLFLSETKDQIQSMGEALASGDYGLLRKQAHTIKGSLGSLHAPRARSRAQQLEGAAANESSESCRGLLSALEADLEILKPELMAMRDGIGPR